MSPVGATAPAPLGFNLERMIGRHRGSYPPVPASKDEPLYDRIPCDPESTPLPALVATPGPDRGPWLDLVVLTSADGCGAAVGATLAAAWSAKVRDTHRDAADTPAWELAELGYTPAGYAAELLTKWAADEWPYRPAVVRLAGPELDVWRVWALLSGYASPDLATWRAMVPWTGSGPDVVAAELASLAEHLAARGVPAESVAEPVAPREPTPYARAMARCVAAVMAAAHPLDAGSLEALAERIESLRVAA